MGLAIFLKQSFRSLKRNWSVVTLVFLFLIVGVSLVVGLSAYLFNAHQLTVGTAFKNGSQDGKIDANNLAWNSESSSSDRDVIFSKAQQEVFKKSIGLPEEFSIPEGKEDEFYSFVINNNGYLQSFLYKDNEFVTEDKGNKENFKNWIDEFQLFNGSALAYYFKEIVNSEINPNWDVRTTDIIGEGSEHEEILKTYLPDEKKFTLTTFDENWIDYDHGYGHLPSSSEGLFVRDDFTYHLRMSYDAYKQIENPIFLIEKNFRDFNLKVGDEIDVYNSLLPPNSKNEKFIIVGDFFDSGKLINFSNTLSGSIPFSHFWETVQSQRDYLDFSFFITINQKNEKGYFGRAKEIQNQIAEKKLFEARAGPENPLPGLITEPNGFYYAVAVFWQVNLPIVLLCIIGIGILIFFVILFTTKQLIENNKATLQFLKSMGLSNIELSSINMTLILIPMLFGFLFAGIGFFVIQNLFSFILETQYPMILNFWMWNFETIFIFLGTVIFTFVVFFLTNISVLKRHNILERKESKWVRRIKSGKLRNYIYDHVKKNTKIELSIRAANFRKNLVTFGVLLVTFSVILFGVGFKGSIVHEAKLVETSFLPFKNFSGTAAPLFAVSENEEVFYSQERIDENELKPIPANIHSDEFKEIIASDLKNHYLSANTIDEIVGDDFDKFLKDLEGILIDAGIPEESIPEALKIFENLYENYQNLKLQLKNLYNSNDDFKFVFGRSVTPEFNVGKTLNLNVKINQRINKQVPPKKINSIGLMDRNLEDIFGLHSRNSRTIDVKISQSLATKLNIFKTELQFKKPTFNFELPLSNNSDQTISVPVRVMEIIRADFTQDAIYYSFDNLMSYLKNLPPPTDIPESQWNEFTNLENRDKLPNAYFSENVIPNSLLNLTIPIAKDDGSSILDYLPDQNGSGVDLKVLDFKIIGKNLISETASYIDLVNRIIYIFIAITIIVSLLLTYLFLVENKQNILLFKALGYSIKQIAKFLLIGYIFAAVIASGLAIGISVLAISLLSNVFVELFNAIIPFAFSPFYTTLFVILPVLFVILILISLWIYIFRQDPKKALDVQ